MSYIPTQFTQAVVLNLFKAKTLALHCFLLKSGNRNNQC